MNSMIKAKDLLTQLLLGLEDALREAVEALKKSMEEQYEKTRDLNDKKIQLRCSEVQRKIEVSTVELYNHEVTTK